VLSSIREAGATIPILVVSFACTALALWRKAAYSLTE
jgi:hypothetical protein